MIKTAKKYGVRPEGIAFQRQTIEKIPIWGHFAGKTELKKTTSRKAKAVKCLQDNHKTKTVGEMARIAEINVRLDHEETNQCECDECNRLRHNEKCEKPQECIERATKILNQISEKWDPRSTLPQDYETEENQETPEIPEFRPWTTDERGETKNIFRVFTEGHPNQNLPEYRPTANQESERVNIATDGSCINNGAHNAIAGAGIFFEDGDERNESLRLPPELTQSNQTGEMAAILRASQIAPEETTIRIETDSKWAINLLTRDRRKAEDRGFIGYANRELIQATIASLRQKGQKAELEWTKGHNGHERNECADELAGEGSAKETPDTLDTTVPPEMKLTGARLSEITQAIAYRAIKEIKGRKRKERERTGKHLELARAQIEEITNNTPSTEAVWEGLRSKDWSRNTRNTMWLIAHDAYMTGTHWNHTSNQELQERATCKHDGCTEDIDHILTKCEAPGQEIIWTCAKTLWVTRGETWYAPGIGNIIGCGAARLTDDKGEPKTGVTRLFRILIAESAHLIWALRCERVISRENQPHSEQEIKERWWKRMQQRLDTDCRLANKKYGRKAISKAKVNSTWAKLLQEEMTLPVDWIERRIGVLVGRATNSEPRRRERRGIG
jgi:ribonuclease HI